MILKKIVVVCHAFPSFRSQKGAYAETLSRLFQAPCFSSLGILCFRSKILIVPSSDFFTFGLKINFFKLIPKNLHLISTLFALSGIFGRISRRIFHLNETLFIANNFYSGAYSYLFSILFSSKYIYVEHSSEYKTSLPINPMKLKLLSCITGRSLLNFAVTDHFAALMTHTSGNYFYTLYNSIDPVFASYSTVCPIQKNKQSYSSINLLSIGSLDHNKNFKEVLNALALLPSHYLKKISFKIIGSGPNKSDLIDQASNICDIGDFQVIPSCSRERIAQYMIASTFLISSSIYETFGMVLIEALSLGTPVLSKRNDSSVEISHTIGNNSGLILWDQPHDLADILIHQIDTYKWTMKSKQSIAASVMDKFSASVIASKLYNSISNLNVYSNLQ